MSKPTDVTLKSLLEDAPDDWPLLAGVRDAKVTVIDADIATISGAADKVLRLGGPPPRIMHFEFQAGPDASLPARVNLGSAALEIRHGLPVQSVVVLLSPRAHLAAISGTHEMRLPGAIEPYRVLRYQVIRVWQLPVESLLGGGLGQLALAPISAVQESDLPGLVRDLKLRMSGVRDRGQLGRWWTAVSVLMGLRYDKQLVAQLLQGVLAMKESVTYQAIVEEGVVEGRLQEVRKLLLRLGQDHFSAPPSAAMRKRIEGMQHLEQLEQLALCVPRLHSWNELFAEPPKPARRNRRRRE